VDGIKVADAHAVAASETAIGTEGLATIERVSYGTALDTVKDIDSGACLAGAIATDDSDEGILLLDRATEYVGHVLHHRISPYGAEEPIEGLVLYAGLGKGGAAGIATVTAIGARERPLHLPDARILLDLEGSHYPIDQQGDDRCCQG